LWDFTLGRTLLGHNVNITITYYMTNDSLVDSIQNGDGKNKTFSLLLHVALDTWEEAHPEVSG